MYQNSDGRRQREKRRGEKVTTRLIDFGNESLFTVIVIVTAELIYMLFRAVVCPLPGSRVYRVWCVSFNDTGKSALLFA